ncbi:MAG: exosortase-associated EpsI family protein [Planctomycetota bacterium]
MARSRMSLLSLAPAALSAVVMLVVMWRVRETWLADPVSSDSYMAAVAEAIDGVPYKIGPWLGIDVEVSPAAVELLRPNRILQRSYRDPSNPASQFNLLISHCGKTVDMLGHYPPVCYPQHGWRALGSHDIEIDSPRGSLPAREYGFTRGGEFGPAVMDIVNFFVMPSDEFTFHLSMDRLNLLEVTRTRYAGGIAQVQVMFPKNMEPSDREEAIRAVLEAIDPVLGQITTRDEGGDLS